MGFTDFFKPQWKHSNPAVRAAAIYAMDSEQQSLLLTVALEAAEPANRMTAARKLTDINKLTALLEKSQEKSIQEWARKKLTSLRTDEAKTEAASPEALQKRLAVLAQITDPKSVEDVAVNAQSLEVRRNAFARVTRAGAFYNLAMAETDEALALKALAKVGQSGQLENLGRNAKLKAVRLGAKEKLKLREKEAAKMNRGNIDKAKMELALQVIEKAAEQAEKASGFSDSLHALAWEPLSEQVEEAQKAIAQLETEGIDLTSEQSERLARNRQVFETGLFLYKKEKILVQEKERREQASREAKTRICEELESLADIEDDGSSAERLSGIRRQWNAIPAADTANPEDDSLRKRFSQAITALENRSRQQAREAKESQTLQEAQDIRGGLRIAAETLAQTLRNPSTDSPSDKHADLGRTLENLQGEWSRLASLPGAGTDPELEQKFHAAISEASSLLKNSFDATTRKREELLSQMEDLVDSHDLLAAEKDFKRLNQVWKDAGPVSPEDYEKLQTRYRSITDRLREALDWLRWSNLQGKQQICAALEELQQTEDKKILVARFRELTGQWKSLGHVPWDSSEALWERYHQVCDTIYERCKEYFAELDEERESNLKAKEELCAKIEAMANAEDWREAMETVREAQSAWKALGAVPKEHTDALWSRYRSACKAFYDTRDAFQQANLARKTELCETAESLQDSTDWRATAAKIKELQEQWKSAGPVPRDKAEALWARFHGACEKFFTARNQYLEHMDAERPANQVKKEEFVRLVESLDELESDKDKFNRVREVQAAWKETGPAPREAEEELWQRFRKACDTFYEQRKSVMADNQTAKEELCAEAEAMIDSNNWKETSERFKSLQEKWRTLGPAPREIDRQLWLRFRSACDAFFGNLKTNAAQRDEDREANLKKKEDLCFEIEMLSGRELNEEETQARMAWQLSKLSENFGKNLHNPDMNWDEAAERVKNCQRAWRGIGPVSREKSDAIWNRFRAACDDFFAARRKALGLKEENPAENLDMKLEIIEEAEKLAEQSLSPEETQDRIRDLNRRWRRIGPVPRAQSEYIWERFRNACSHEKTVSQASTPVDATNTEA